MVVITEKYIYIIEFKVDKEAEVGMLQIKEKEYFYSYLHNKSYEDRSIILMFISFDPETKGGKNYLVETVR